MSMWNLSRKFRPIHLIWRGWHSTDWTRSNVWETAYVSTRLQCHIYDQFFAKWGQIWKFRFLIRYCAFQAKISWKLPVLLGKVLSTYLVQHMNVTKDASVQNVYWTEFRPALVSWTMSMYNQHLRCWMFVVLRIVAQFLYFLLLNERSGNQRISNYFLDIWYSIGRHQ